MTLREGSRTYAITPAMICEHPCKQGVLYHPHTPLGL
jgi:hypothetical protein